MSDLMDTKKVTKTRTKAEDCGEIIHNDYTNNSNRYVTVKKPDGTIITGNAVIKPDSDDMYNW